MALIDQSDTVCVSNEPRPGELSILPMEPHSKGYGTVTHWIDCFQLICVNTFLTLLIYHLHAFILPLYKKTTPDGSPTCWLRSLTCASHLGGQGWRRTVKMMRINYAFHQRDGYHALNSKLYFPQEQIGACLLLEWIFWEMLSVQKINLCWHEIEKYGFVPTATCIWEFPFAQVLT